MSELTDFIKFTSYMDVRPTLITRDGFSMSVQASKEHYCNPKRNDLPRYSSYEIGFPHPHEPMLDVFSEDYGDGIYPYVPQQVVETIIEKHDGIDFDAIAEGYVIREDKMEEIELLGREIHRLIHRIDNEVERLKNRNGIYIHLFKESYAEPNDPPSILVRTILEEMEEDALSDVSMRYRNDYIPVLISPNPHLPFADDLTDIQAELYGGDWTHGSEFSTPALESIENYGVLLLQRLEEIYQSLEQADWITEWGEWFQVGEVPDVDAEGYPDDTEAVLVGDIGDEYWDYYLTDDNFISGSLHDFIRNSGLGYEIRFWEGKHIAEKVRY